MLRNKKKKKKNKRKTRKEERKKKKREKNKKIKLESRVCIVDDRTFAAQIPRNEKCLAARDFDSLGKFKWISQGSSVSAGVVYVTRVKSIRRESWRMI